MIKVTTYEGKLIVEKDKVRLELDGQDTRFLLRALNDIQIVNGVPHKPLFSGGFG